MPSQNANNFELGTGSPANERKNTNNKFNELTKSIARSVTPRAALKKFGVGLAAIALPCLWLSHRAQAGALCDPGAILDHRY